MQYLALLVFLMVPQEKPGVVYLADLYSWNSLTPGVTTRASIEKRFGPPLVIDATGHIVYDEPAIKRAGQSEDLPARQIGLAYSGGVLIAIRIHPRDQQTDTWWQRRFGEPPILVRDAQSKKATILIWHSRHVVATVDQAGGITTMWVTIEQPMTAHAKPAAQ